MAGTAVVVSDCAGSSIMLGNGHAGRVVPPADSRAIATAIQDLERTGALSAHARRSRIEWAGERLTAHAGAAYFEQIVRHRMGVAPRTQGVLSVRPFFQRDRQDLMPLQSERAITADLHAAAASGALRCAAYRSVARSAHRRRGRSGDPAGQAHGALRLRQRGGNARCKPVGLRRRWRHTGSDRGLGFYGLSLPLVRWLRANRSRIRRVRRAWNLQFHSVAAWCGVLGSRVPPVRVSARHAGPMVPAAYPRKHLKKRIYWALLERWVFARAERVLFTCETELERARRPFLGRHRRLAVNGFGSNAARPAPMRRRRVSRRDCAGQRQTHRAVPVARSREEGLRSAHRRLRRASPPTHPTCAS